MGEPRELRPPRDPKFISLGHPTIETVDIHNLEYISSTRPKNCNGLRSITDRDYRPAHTHDCETMSKTTAYRNHIKNLKIETREVFERETSSNILTRLDKNQLSRSTDSSKHEETHKWEVNPNPEPSSSDTLEKSSSESKAKKKKSTKKKKRRKHRKYDSSDPYSSNKSDYFDDSHNRRKRRNNKKHQKKDPIRICATLTAKFLTTAYKSKISRLKMDEDPLQRRIYVLTFVESLKMILSQYK